MKIRRWLDPNERWTLAAATGITLALVPFGWQAGYHAVSAYVLAWTFTAATLLVSVRIASCCWGWAGFTDATIRIGVLALALAVACGMLLGSLGAVGPAAYAALLSVAFVLSRFLGPSLWPRSASVPQLAALPVAVVGIAAALLAFMVGFAMTHAPLTLYDSLSYHLFFPARWLQDGGLSIIPTPFSDEAQAYAPDNGELFLLWLMVPFHGDLLARMGQLPFALLGAATVYALARRLGARREHAIYPAVFFLLSRQVFEQAMGANVDLICAALFLASLYLGVLAVERDQTRDWLFWGVSLGLYWGTKYLALVYTPIFLLLAVARGPRIKTLWAFPGIAAFALPWYMRNWIVAGSPIYPASLQMAGFTFARGAFNRSAMLNGVFHTDQMRLFPAMAAHLFGPASFLFWIPFALVGGVRCVRRGWWPNGLVLLVPVLMVPLYWFGFPVNIDSRFLMPALGAALLPFAFVFGRSPRWNAAVHALCALGMLWILVGVHASLPVALPWFMGDWLALNGLVPSRFLLAFAGVTLAMVTAWRLLVRWPSWAAPMMAGLVAATALVLTLGANSWCAPGKCDYLDTTSPYIRAGLIDAWGWLARHVTHSTVAYTGINLPYPLSGDQLTNRVVYVNTDGHPRWRFHDYDRAYRDGRFSPEPPVLARSSGELEPVSERSGPRDDASRPRYERLEGFRDGWISNLGSFGVTRLFVSSLSAYEIDYVWHNTGGFPIEDEWAKADPRAFELLYENPQVRIYAVTVPGEIRFMNESRSLSVIIPAYNEAENIVATLENVTTALGPLSLPYEVLVVDDGSRDNTAELVIAAAARFPHVRLLKNERNMGFGWSYRRGVEAASLTYAVMVHGDNAWGWPTLRDFFGHTGEADVIIGYTRDMLRSRTWSRTLISKIFTLLVNLITGRHLTYYNGLQIHRAHILKGLRIESHGYGFQAEVLVKSLRVAGSYVEVPMDLIERQKGESKAFRVKNVVDVVRTLKLLTALERGSHG